MSHYVEKMVKEVPQENLKGASVTSPWNENLFKVQHDSAPLEKEQFHTVTVQGLFLCKCGHPDIAPARAYLTTYVQKPNHADWTKLYQMMQFLKQPVKDKLTLRADGSGHLSWHCNTAFVLHDDFRSHTDSIFLMGDGAITSLIRKQGMNTKSSTEVEVVGTDKIVSPMIWTGLFLKAQGYPVKENILYQDNESSMLLKTNRQKSAGKHSHHSKIQFFYIADQKAKGHIDIKYCPTDEMIGDYMTKPLMEPSLMASISR